MNYSIKLDLSKIQGAHVISNFQTKAGARKAVVIVLDENPNIEMNDFGVQVKLTMFQKKEAGKSGTHFLKESAPKEMPIEQRNSLPFVGNAWELAPKNAPKTPEQQYAPFPTNNDAEPPF